MFRNDFHLVEVRRDGSVEHQVSITPSFASHFVSEDRIALHQSVQSMLSACPQSFEQQVAYGRSSVMFLKWERHGLTTGLLMQSDKTELLTVNLLLSGVDPEEERLAEERFHRLISGGDKFGRPADIGQFPNRPLLLTVAAAGFGVRDFMIDEAAKAVAEAFFVSTGAINPDHAEG